MKFDEALAQIEQPGKRYYERSCIGSRGSPNGTGRPPGKEKKSKGVNGHW
jgi:hypothetical protein